jgi:hypothetical protein
MLMVFGPDSFFEMRYFTDAEVAKKYIESIAPETA